MYHGKITYERHVYESIDDESLNFRLHLKIWLEKGVGQYLMG